MVAPGRLDARGLVAVPIRASRHLGTARGSRLDLRIVLWVALEARNEDGVRLARCEWSGWRCSPKASLVDRRSGRRHRMPLQGQGFIEGCGCGEGWPDCAGARRIDVTRSWNSPLAASMVARAQLRIRASQSVPGERMSCCGWRGWWIPSAGRGGGSRRGRRGRSAARRFRSSCRRGTASSSRAGSRAGRRATSRTTRGSKFDELGEPLRR